MGEKSSVAKDQKTESKSAQSDAATKATPAGLAFEDNRPEAQIQLKINEGLDAQKLSAPSISKSNSYTLQPKANLSSLQSRSGPIASESPSQLKNEELGLQSLLPTAPNPAQFAGAGESSPPSSGSSSNSGLPQNLKSGVEKLSGQSMSDVTVHQNSEKPAQLNAHAYAKGSDIHLGPGQEKHLPHEAWHVAQQKQGRVQPTRQLKGKVPVNDDKGLEQEADVMGARALQLGNQMTVAPTPGQFKAVSGAGTVQGSFMDSVKSAGAAVVNWFKGLFGKKSKPVAGAAKPEGEGVKKEQQVPEVTPDGVPEVTPEEKPLNPSFMGQPVEVVEGSFTAKMFGHDVAFYSAAVDKEGVLSFAEQQITIPGLDTSAIPFDTGSFSLTVSQVGGKLSLAGSAKATAKAEFDGIQFSDGSADINFQLNSSLSDVDALFSAGELTGVLPGGLAVSFSGLSGNRESVSGLPITVTAGGMSVPVSDIGFSMQRFWYATGARTEPELDLGGLKATNVMVTLRRHGNEHRLTATQDLATGPFTGFGFSDIVAQQFLTSFRQHSLTYSYSTIDQKWNFDMNIDQVTSKLFTKSTIFRNLTNQGDNFVAKTASMPLIGEDARTLIKTEKNILINDFTLNYKTGAYSWSSAEVRVPIVVENTPFDMGEVNLVLEQSGQITATISLNSKFPSINLNEDTKLSEFKGKAIIIGGGPKGFRLEFDKAGFSAESGDYSLSVDGLTYNDGTLTIEEGKLSKSEAGNDASSGLFAPDGLVGHILEIVGIGAEVAAEGISVTDKKVQIANIQLNPIFQVNLLDSAKLTYNPRARSGEVSGGVKFPPDSTPNFPLSIMFSFPLPPVPGLNAIGKLGATASIGADFKAGVKHKGKNDDGQSVFGVSGKLNLNGSARLEIGAGVSAGFANAVEVGGMLVGAATARMNLFTEFNKDLKKDPAAMRMIPADDNKKLLDFEFLSQFIATAEIQLVVNSLFYSGTLYSYILKRWDMGNKGFEGDVSDKDGKWVINNKPKNLSADGREVDKPEIAHTPVLGEEAYRKLVVMNDVIIKNEDQASFIEAKEKLVELREAYLLTLKSSAQGYADIKKKYANLDRDYNKATAKVKKYTEKKANKSVWKINPKRASWELKLRNFQKLVTKLQPVVAQRDKYNADVLLATTVLAILEPANDDAKIGAQLAKVSQLISVLGRMEEYAKILQSNNIGEEQKLADLQRDQEMLAPLVTESQKEITEDDAEEVEEEEERNPDTATPPTSQSNPQD